MHEICSYAYGDSALRGFSIFAQVMKIAGLEKKPGDRRKTKLNKDLCWQRKDTHLLILSRSRIVSITFRTHSYICHCHGNSSIAFASSIRCSFPKSSYPSLLLVAHVEEPGEQLKIWCSPLRCARCSPVASPSCSTAFNRGIGWNLSIPNLIWFSPVRRSRRPIIQSLPSDKISFGLKVVNCVVKLEKIPQGQSTSLIRLLLRLMLGKAREAPGFCRRKNDLK